MAVYTIEAKKSLTLSLTGRYLSILSVSGVLIGKNESGIKPFTLKAGYIVDVLDQQWLEIENNTNQNATIDLELNNVKIESASGGEVSIVGDVRVSEIVQGISVTADATVQNGTMQLNESNVINHLNDVTIPANGIVELVPARNAKGRRVQISNISSTVTLCRIGGAGVTASQGTPLRGSENVPASWLISTRAAIYARNTSGDTAKISLTEFYSND